MAPAPIDPAILRALSLDPTRASIISHGGSGFASTFRITTSSSNSTSTSTSTHSDTNNSTTTPAESFFVKTSSSAGASTMFAGEDASLNAIHAFVPSLCPKSLCWGEMEEKKKKKKNGSFFLVTEFLDMSGRGKSTTAGKTRDGGASGSGGKGMSLVQKLAKLHTTPAPFPGGNDDGHGRRRFGFPVPTCCGDTPQPNTFTDSWAEFFANNRLLFILGRGESRNGPDAGLRRLVEMVVEKVVPRLLRPGHLGGKDGILPVVVHGDLWSGNKGRGVFVRCRDRRAGLLSSSTIEDREEAEAEKEDDEAEERGEEEEEDVIYDPSACYAHSEYELGIMRMFGGFDASFMREYHTLVPKTEPVTEYEDRVQLYEVYHHLNHWAIFGAGYRNGAVGILKRLLKNVDGD